MKRPFTIHRSLFETHAFSATINAPVGEIALPRDGGSAARAFPASGQLPIIEANNSASNAFDPP
jgi:hypothetical protein